ncbi:hypothetical protein AAFF_G00207450 [Aldrovandia affinis]|uniref:Uncharacterized protein n=1 Tax=Aldrovandia affinis TaxID=143900 RepID=A0AAD7RHJ1_9TELE|nr:hypothetical protein AAFF_G00207450 [Aldrovandia affinis]
MEIWKLLVLIVAIFALVYCAQGSSPNYEKEYWSAEGWKDEPSENNLASRMADLIKRSKSQQFYGLMGRRSGGPVRLGRKRNKGEMFVGLMGRRSSSGELEEEWDKHQLY